MAQAPALPETAPESTDRGAMVHPTVQAPPVSPGKVAVWLFLATEVMFFTGLIGSYVVLRSGSPPTAFSNQFSPGSDLALVGKPHAVVVEAVGANAEAVIEAIHAATGWSEHEVEERLHSPLPTAVLTGASEARAETFAAELREAGATVDVQGLRTYPWPRPYDTLLNPLSIDLTALNTFFLICSSVTMVLALAAIQRGDRRKLSLYLLATVLIGSLFLSIQIVEYYQLTFGHTYSIGVSADGRFRPSTSLFGSCFFTMTGFHGAHVAGGVVMLTCILIQSLRGAYTENHHSPVELVGLYWHFVDLVWILLFTVVYLI